VLRVLLLSTLGLAIGFSADERNVDPAKIGSGSVIWARVALHPETQTAVTMQACHARDGRPA
jgi:hypothetical protein